MKKLFILGMVFVSSLAMAADSDTLTLSGTVVAVNDLVITPNADATSLNITGGEVNKLVATASETSNNLTGYKIYMRSVNSSLLVHSVDSSKSTSYTISYDGGTAVSLTTTDLEVKNVSSLSGLTTVTSNINVNVTAYATAPAGTYSDTVTVSIVAN